MMRLVVAALALLGLPGLGRDAHAFERARPMGLYPASGPALAMLDSRIEVTVRGPIVETVVVQRFRNGTDRATEATYIFPLPADAAVSAMVLRTGTRAIHAAIEPRDQAQRRYEAAVAAGTAAALLDQERPDVFTQAVSAIPARGIVEVTLRYDTVARHEAGSWELVVPMVVAPRYVPGTASGRAITGSGRSPDTDRAPDASRVTPAAAPGAGGATQIAIHFVDEPTELASPTHELGGSRRDATLLDPRSDHDAVVRWRAAAPSAGWVERDGDGGFAAVVVEAPPAAPRKAPIRVILAIDRAATTRGDADAVERPLVRALLGALDRADRVRVIGSDAIGWTAPTDALAAVERSWATQAGPFDLTRVLEAARPDGAAIVLVTDGLVADDPAAIAAARRLGVAVHAIGIGPAPARATLQQIAAITSGTARFAVAGDDVAALARAALADVASAPPPLAINWGTLAASEVEPAALPRLGAGQAMLVTARIKRAQAANARVRGEVFAFAALAPARPVDGAVTARGALARRWARDRLGGMLAGPHDREAVTRFALAYGLVSPYTSLVAIGSDVVVQGGVKHSVAVPVALPAGMQWHAVKRAHDIDTSGAGAGAPAKEVREQEPEAAVRPPPTTTPARPVAPAPTTPARPLAPAPTTPAPKTPAIDAPRPTEPPARKDRPRKAPPRAAGPPAAAPTPPPPPPPAPEPVPSKADAAAPADRSPRAEDEDRPRKTRRNAERAGEADDDGDDEEASDTEDLARARPKDIAAQAPTIDVQGTSIGDVLQGEEVSISGSRRALRLTAALGAGLAFDHGTRGLAALDLRLETTRRTAFGVEGALWLLGGDVEGRALLSVARRGLARWFELGAGAGIHAGNGTGIATALRLRVNTPLPFVAGYLRYDGAILLSRPRVEAEHAFTLGLELSY